MPEVEIPRAANGSEAPVLHVFHTSAGGVGQPVGGEPDPVHDVVVGEAVRRQQPAAVEFEPVMEAIDVPGPGGVLAQQDGPGAVAGDPAGGIQTEEANIRSLTVTSAAPAGMHVRSNRTRLWET